MTHLLAGMLLGLAGSLHCVGMCGPLLLFVEGARRSVQMRGCFFAHHAGRLTVYGLLGAAAGWSGDAIARAGWRNGLAIAAGLVLIAQASGWLGRIVGVAPARWIGRLTAGARPLAPAHPLARSAAFGVLNGLLPCGLVYAALAAAAGLGNTAAAIMFVAGFGVGTLPVFVLLSWSATAFLPQARGRLAKAAPIALALVGLLLIARGWPLAQHASH
jgi:sulfite exporter TauE/SafE